MMWSLLAAVVAAALYPSSPILSVSLSAPLLSLALLASRSKTSLFAPPSFPAFLDGAVPLLLAWGLRAASRRCFVRLRRWMDRSDAGDSSSETGSGVAVAAAGADAVRREAAISAKTAAAYVSLIRGGTVDGVSLDDTPYPPCLLETLMFCPALELFMKSPGLSDAGISPTGLIHVGQKCLAYDPMAGRRVEGSSWAQSLLGRPLSTDLRLGSIEAVPKGTLVTVLFDVRRESELVWRGETRLLSPDAESIRKLKEAKRGENDGTEKIDDAAARKAATENSGPVATKRWSLPSASLGYSYGQTSHDFNLHHLPLLCCLVGFRRPILQGMMSLSRAVEEVREASPEAFSRGYPIEVECEWKVPLYLPGEASVEVCPSGEFRVTDGKGRPHCVGRVMPALRQSEWDSEPQIGD